MIKFNDLALTNKLLILFAIPLVLYITMVFSFILVPFMLAFFITLLFMPFMRWMRKKNIHKIASIGTVLLVIFLAIFIGSALIWFSGQEIIDGKEELYRKLDAKVGSAIAPYAKMAGLDTETYPSAIKSILFSKKMTEFVYDNFGHTLYLVQKTITLLLFTLFFLVLLLAGSLNLERIMSQTLFKNKMRSVKTYMKIEHIIVKFLKVKFLMSFFTGIGFGLVAWGFGLSFPLFWGLFAFSLNFIQMIGSIVSTIVAALFAYIEFEQPGTVLAAALAFTAIQVIFGSIIEPIMLGRSFSINIIAVLVMLMFWGFLWGIPGIILSIPISVFVKTLLEQFTSAQPIAKLMS